MRYALTPKARSDLDGIWDYTAQRWDADQADRYIRQIARTFSDLANARFRGAKRTTFGSDISGNRPDRP